MRLETTLRPSKDTVRGTRVTLEHSGEILGKKVSYRMIGNGLIVPRDLYDIATARKQDPEALQVALSVLRETELRDIASELGQLRGSWMKQQDQPLIRPVNQHDADHAVRIVREQMERHLLWRIRARARDQDFER